MSIKFEEVANNENGLLTKLFRDILFETGAVNELRYKINRYINAGGVLTKGSLLSKIQHKEMTWYTFVMLLFNILKIKKMTLKITLEHASGIETVHTLVSTAKKKNVKVKKNVKQTDNDNRTRDNK